MSAAAAAATGTGPSTARAGAVTARDRVDDRRAALVGFGVMAGLFALGASVQAVFVLGILPYSMRPDGTAPPLLNLVIRLAANGGAVAMGLAGVRLLAPQERRLRGRLAVGAAIAAAVAVTRAGLQLALGIYGPGDSTEVTAEFVTTAIVVGVALTVAVGQTDARRRLRAQERAVADQTLRASVALEALQGEELRIRREVADGLHGTVQQRFILLGARLNALIDLTAADSAEARADGDGGLRAELESIRDDLAALREQDLRAMGELLYPAQLDQGAVPAIRALLRRLPATIAVTAEFSPAAEAIEGRGMRRLTPERRLLLVRLCEEALSNALKHGRATGVALTVDHERRGGSAGSSGVFRITFDDDGSGLPPGGAEPRLNGLRRLSDQLELIGGSLVLGRAPLGGVRLQAVVPDGLLVA